MMSSSSNNPSSGYGTPSNTGSPVVKDKEQPIVNDDHVWRDQSMSEESDLLLEGNSEEEFELSDEDLDKDNAKLKVDENDKANRDGRMLNSQIPSTNTVGDFEDLDEIDKSSGDGEKLKSEIRGAKQKLKENSNSNTVVSYKYRLISHS